MDKIFFIFAGIPSKEVSGDGVPPCYLATCTALPQYSSKIFLEHLRLFCGRVVSTKIAASIP
jgi:hypothetical protein